MELLSDAHFALMLLLAARRDRTDLEDGADGAGGSDLPLSAEKTAQALKYGVYSTTHLLALAFDVEVCYWRWGACLEGKGAVVDVSDAGGEASVAAPEGEAGEWHKRACVSAHRYLHTVLVLMEGCEDGRAPAAAERGARREGGEGAKGRGGCRREGDGDAQAECASKGNGAWQ